jgi:hypothetical protein
MIKDPDLPARKPLHPFGLIWPMSTFADWAGAFLFRSCIALNNSGDAIRRCGASMRWCSADSAAVKRPRTILIRSFAPIASLTDLGAQLVF